MPPPPPIDPTSAANEGRQRYFAWRTRHPDTDLSQRGFFEIWSDGGAFALHASSRLSRPDVQNAIRLLADLLEGTEP
jgi:quinol monooxygenase YgiN